MLIFPSRTLINDHSFYRCSRCDETCKASGVEDHARNHILIDECTTMMFELCEDGRNDLYECNLLELGKHYHCKMFNCNFVISVNGGELKRLQHFKQHEDEQKDSFIDDVTYSSSSSINSTTDLNCSNSIGQSNSFIDTTAESSYLASSSPLELNSNPPAKATNQKIEPTLNESIANSSNQNSPNFLKEELEQFANSLLGASPGGQFDLAANSVYASSLDRSQDAGKMQKLQNCLLDGSASLSASLLKRKRGRPPKKMEDDLVCSSKRNHLSAFFNPFNQDGLAGLGNNLAGNLAGNLSGLANNLGGLSNSMSNHLDKRAADQSSVSMFLNSLLMQQQNEMLDVKDSLNSNLNNLNNNLNSNLNSLGSSLNNSMGNQQTDNYPNSYPGNYQAMASQADNQAAVQAAVQAANQAANQAASQAASAFLQQQQQNRDTFLANQSSINFQMLNYIANLNQTPSQSLVSQLISPNLNSVLHQQQQLYKNLLKQQKKSAGHTKSSD